MDAPESMELAREALGRQYRIERLLARAGVRAIFVAWDPLLGRRIALRVHFDPEAGDRAWFLREMQVLATLDHPAICHVYAAGLAGALAYRTGNWVEGESLATAMQRGPRPIPAVLALARHLLDALEHAHARGIVIRRILPTTLLLEVTGRGVLTDLRFANRCLEVIPPGEGDSDHPFVAPEARGGEPGEPAADIYAVGAILYHAVTGSEPAREPGAIRPPRALRPACPQAVERVILRALGARPSERYLTAAEMLADLAADTGAFNEPHVPPPSPDTAGWERRLRRALGDDYELLGPLGSGAFGHVYRVRDLRLEREVALKVLEPALTAEAPVVERFTREAQLAARLQHPNIVDVYDIGGRSGLIWYTMELIRGRNVAQLVEAEGPLPVARAVQLALDALAALEHAHRERLVHRDIKPENLLVGPDGRARVGDFGLALALPKTRLFGGATSRSGTPQFAAPEQLIGAQVDERTDLFSLGAVAYFMLLGRPPFEGRTAEAVRRGQIGARLPDLRAARADVSAILEAALRRATALDPEARYASAAEFRDALQRTGAAAPAGVGRLGRLGRWLRGRRR